MGDLVESMKTAALEAMENSDPCCIMFGQVINTSPLQIQVNSKLILDEQVLKLTRNVTDFITEVTVEWVTETELTKHSHSMGKKSITLALTEEGDPLHTHEVDDFKAGTSEVDLAHTHDIVGKKAILVHNGLKLGEEVILIRQKGGQEYIVLDRVG